MEVDYKKLEVEIQKNFEFFCKQEFDHEQRNKFALIRNCEIIEIMNTREDMKKFAQSKFEDGIYSIQQILPPAVDLGSLSHALRTD